MNLRIPWSCLYFFWPITPKTGCAEKRRTEAAEKDEKEKKRKELAELLVTLAVQRRDNERAMHESRGDVAKGLADYVVGTGSVVRPSVLESFI